jgi:hypothetical protein
MLLVKASNNTVVQYPYSLGLLRKDNPNTSFPKKPSASDMAAFGVHPVTEVTPSLGDGQKLTKVWTPTLSGSDWVLAHQAVDLTVEEVAAATAVVAANVREARDKLIKATDFYALSDVVMTTEMTAYRQALRTLPEQEGFPTTVTWPTAP